MKWVITGGAGFIGCHAAARFIRAGHEVVVIDHLDHQGATENLVWLKSQGLTDFARIDLRDAQALQSFFETHANASAVLHLASYSGLGRSTSDPKTLFEINALGTLNLLEALRHGARFKPVLVHGSCRTVYGARTALGATPDRTSAANTKPYRTIDESETIEPDDSAACSKAAAEQYVHEYVTNHGLKAVIFRQSYICGPRQFDLNEPGSLSSLCTAAMLQQPLYLPTDGTQLQDVLWVDDVIDAYERTIDQIGNICGEVVNIGGGPENVLQLQEWVEVVERLVGPVEVQFDQSGQAVEHSFIADISKAERLLGWKPTVPAKDTIERSVTWLIEHQSMLVQILEDDGGVVRHSAPSTLPIRPRPSRELRWRAHAAHPLLRRPLPRPKPQRNSRGTRPVRRRIEFPCAESLVVVYLPHEQDRPARASEAQLVTRALERALAQAQRNDDAENAA
jgi:CDP-paratose 2-epimerase